MPPGCPTVRQVAGLWGKHGLTPEAGRICGYHVDGTIGACWIGAALIDRGMSIADAVSIPLDEAVASFALRDRDYVRGAVHGFDDGMRHNLRFSLCVQVSGAHEDGYRYGHSVARALRAQQRLAARKVASPR
jgi:hypothetical protein